MANGALRTPGQKDSGQNNDEEGSYRHPISPDLGPGHDEASGKPYDPRGHDAAAGNPSDPRGDGLDSVRQNENSGSLYNPRGDSGSTLKSREESGDDTVGSGYSDGAKPKRAPGRFRITRRRGAVIGVTTVFALVTGGFFGISSGPLEFIHIAQLLEKFHFSAQEDASNGRLMKIARYIRDPSKPQNTRLGIIGNAVADHLETKIHDATGLNSKYDPSTGTFEGYTVDPEHEQFKGLTADEIKARLASKYGLDIKSMSTVTIKDSAGKDQERVLFNPDTGGINTPKRYLVSTGFARGLLGEAGLSKISTWAGTRVLTRRASWTFHPITELDTQIRTAAIKGGKKGIDKLKQAFQDKFFSDVEGTIESPGGHSQPKSEPGTNGNPPTTDPNSTANAGGVDGVQADAQGENPKDPVSIDKASASLKAKVTGGGAALIGVICVMHSIDQNVSKERQAKVILPMMRLAGQFISLGSQAQKGQDISALQLGFYKGYLDGTDSNGNVTSTWNQARSIQAELGQPQNGPDIPKAGQVFNTDVPFSIIEGPITDTACGILGSTFGQIFSIVTGPISYIVSGEILKDVTGSLADWLSGAPINIATGAGAIDGNYINYGARASANDQYASAGGVPMDTGDEASLKNTTAVLDNQDFKSKSIAYRIFNPDDSQSLASSIMDNYGSSGVAQGFARMFSNFGSIFATALKAPATLFSGISHAADQPYNYHNLKKVGFTAADLANPLFDNTFDNGCYVTGGTNCKVSSGPLSGKVITPAQSILGDPSQLNNNLGPGYNYAKNIKICFGDTISYDGSVWNIDFGSAPVDMYSDAYTSINCASHDTSWMRIRFWILDTQTFEGYDCSQGNTTTSDQSCQDVGFSNSSSSASTTSTTGSSDISAYQNPLRDVMKNPGFKAERIDQGVDYTGTGNVYAIGNGTINGVYPDWYLSEPLIAYTLTDGPAAGKTVYFAECITPSPDIASGKIKTVTSSTVIGQMTNCGNGVETGWGDPAHLPNSMAHDVWVGHDSTAYYTAYGKNFSDLLVKLGAPAGTIQAGAQELGSLQSGWPTSW